MYAETGTLLTYGPDMRTTAGRAAAYVDRIFWGAAPADLPIEQPTKFELAINPSVCWEEQLVAAEASSEVCGDLTSKDTVADERASTRALSSARGCRGLDAVSCRSHRAARRRSSISSVRWAFPTAR